MIHCRSAGVAVLMLGTLVAMAVARADEQPLRYDATAAALKLIGAMQVQPLDWPQWGGSSLRNNTPEGKNIPVDWDIRLGRNIKWRAQLGSQTYGNPVIANGYVYVGSNNGNGYIERYPNRVDLGVLLCFDEKDGKFLWQHSNENRGRLIQWPLQGVTGSPYVDGQRLWYVNDRVEVCCLDTDGFRDGENDGPFTDEPTKDGAGVPIDMQYEADVVWKFDMVAQLNVSPYRHCHCSVTCAGETLFVSTSNGVDESQAIPQPQAPSFLALDRNTGIVLWWDGSPGFNILHGQWSSPAYGVFYGQPQVLFAGGDGWLYSFDPEGNGKHGPKLLWRFDCNPKESFYSLGGKATRNNLLATPVVYDGLIYIAVGEDPEHGEGVGHLWCIDPTRRGDVSPELVFNKARPDKPIGHRRIQACDPRRGDFTQPNPNSAAVWHYDSYDINQNKKIDFDEQMHRSIGTAAIKNDLLFIADFGGLVHCVNAKTGVPYWTHDLLAASWGSALIVDDHVYFGDEDGDVTIFELSAEKRVVAELSMGNSVYSTPVVANNVLFVSNKDELFAIEKGAMTKPKPLRPR